MTKPGGGAMSSSSVSISDDVARDNVTTKGDAGITPYDDKSKDLEALIQGEIRRWSEKRMQDGPNARRTICRRENLGEKDAFVPRAVSIGPQHHGREELGFMEELKPGFIRSLMSRSKEPDHFLTACINLVLKEEVELQEFYAYLPLPQHFMKLVVLDACFVLDFLIRLHHNDFFVLESNKNGECETTNSEACYEMLNGESYLIPLIICDLLLLENQLPLSLLSKIYKLLLSLPAEGKDYSNFGELVITFLDRVTKALTGVATDEHYVRQDFETEVPEVGHSSLNCMQLKHRRSKGNPASSLWARFPKTPHLLQLYYRFSTNSGKRKYVTTSAIRRVKIQVGLDNSLDDFFLMRIPTATILKESGINIRKQAPPFSILSISFHDGILELPPIFMGPSTVSLLKNMVELESRQIELQPLFSAYIQFLDHIINTRDDVALLRRKRIVEHSYGSDDQAANSFNSLVSGHIHYNPHFLMPINLLVNKYCNSKRNRWLANLKQKYFSSPWSCLALFTAFFLLFLTFLQTLYAMMAYHCSKKAS